MRYLLDTHYVLWAVSDIEKIPANILDLVTNADNTVFVSTVSFWEISLKYSLHKLEIKGFKPEEIPDACLQASFRIEELSIKDSSTYHMLKATYHKDPFDRMLIWQAIQNDYTLISMDKEVKKYLSEGLKVIG